MVDTKYVIDDILNAIVDEKPVDLQAALNSVMVDKAHDQIANMKTEIMSDAIGNDEDDEDEDIAVFDDFEDEEEDDLEDDEEIEDEIEDDDEELDADELFNDLEDEEETDNQG